MKKNSLPTAEYVRSIFNYDRETGLFTRSVRTGMTSKVGDIAGSPCSDGYIQIRIRRIKYAAHRLAWLHVTGKWPTSPMDHIDGDPANNRWANLRLADPAQNSWNTKTKRTSTTGLKGVCKNKRGFIAKINVRGESIYLGYFKRAEDAHAAYVKAAREHHGEFARTA